MDELIIAARFNGPPGTGNGGYTCGLVAQRHAPAASGQVRQVTLRVPPPLDTPLQVSPREAGGVLVHAGSRLVAEAQPVALPDGPPVPPVSAAEAEAAAAAYQGFVHHPFPSCYVCGPRRAADDGLKIFPGTVPDGRTAAPWLVPDGCSEVTVWAALDCPGGWAVLVPDRTCVLGRMAAQVYAVPPPGTSCVVVGAVESTEGRVSQVQTALYRLGPDGSQLLARARATWVAI